ncbi:MAG: hypothetical protein ACHQF2_10885 [Flavobacteriales bacterium]
MGIKRNNIKLVVLLVAFCFQGELLAQKRSLDREKWKELRGEIKKRRYDAREVITDRDLQRENRTYYDNEDANKWSENDERLKDPDNRSDYSSSDNGNSEDGSGRNNDGNGNNNRNGESNGESDSDIFDDNAGRGNDSEDELGNSTWDDEQSGNGNGGSRSTDKNTYKVDPPERDASSSRSSSSLGSGGGISAGFMYVLLGVLIAVALFFILRSIDWKNKKVKKSEILSTDRFEMLEFTKSELELAIEKALAEGNFREAIRIYFLAVVKELRDKGLIKWEKKKTNNAYLNEMFSHPQFNRFEFATRIFEVVWYGNRKINSDEFKSVEPVYKGLLRDIVKR